MDVSGVNVYQRTQPPVYYSNSSDHDVLVTAEPSRGAAHCDESARCTDSVSTRDHFIFQGQKSFY